MVTTSIDVSGLNDAISERIQAGRRTAAEVVNTAGYWVARNTFNYSPASSLRAIDTALKITTRANLTPSGNVGKKRHTSGNVTIKYKGKIKDVPIAALIISARAKARSRYNILTNNRWFLAKHPMKDVSRAAGRSAMRSIINQMVSVRHKSISYLRSGWIKAFVTLGPYAQKSGHPNSGQPDRTTGLGASLEARGDATIAQPGNTPLASITNATGGLGANAIEQNEALWHYIGPALQRAIDEEEQSMRIYTAKKIAQMNAEFNKRRH